MDDSTNLKSKIQNPKSKTDARPRRIAVNTGYLLIAYAIEAAFAFFLLGVVARYLSQAGFGRYGYVISFIELAIMITEFSNSRVLVREIARDKQSARVPLDGTWTLRLMLSVLMIGVVVVAGLATGADQELWWAILLFAVGQVFFNLGEVFTAVYRGFQQMQYQAIVIVSGQALTVVLCLVAIYFDLGLVGLFAARLVANFVRLIIAWFISRTRFLAERISRNWREMWYLLRESIPVGINLVLRRFIWRGGIVLLTITLNAQLAGSGDLAAGLLYGPLRLVEQARIIPASLVGALLPVMSEQAQQDMVRFRSTLYRSFKLFITVSLFLAVVVTVLAEPITHLLLGSDLAESARILGVFGWIIVLTFANQYFEASLLAVGRQWIVAWGLAIGFVIGALASWLWLMPTYQALGVAYGIMLAEGFVFCVSFVAMLSYFSRRQLVGMLVKIGAAWLVTASVFYLLQSANVFLAAFLGTLSFLVAILLFRVFDQKELEAIVTMVTFPKRLRWIRRKLFKVDPTVRQVDV
jgi:O-antigen/teichoic acid export membrane protein